ncbi:SDR family NAD(P)-dependent oxidoreductase [Nocardioides pacificus]
MTSEPPYDPRALFDVTDRVAVVTGASSGLGRQFARALHAAGAQVVAVARRAERLADLAAECPGLVPHRLDVTDEAGCTMLVDDVMARFGRIDLLVNNAGLGTPAPAVEEDLSDFRYTLEVDLVSCFNLARLVARPMIAAGSGSIVNIASVYGIGSSYPVPNASYTAAKGAIINLTRELGAQWGKHGVRVNAIAPGFFRSEAAEEVFTNEKAHARLVQATPMRRLGAERELDGALIYLASEASSYVNGHTLVVDGGYTTH